MRVTLATAIVLAVFATPALAQQKNPLQMKYEAEEKERKETEKAYNDTMRRTRTTEPAPKTDPWGKVRPTGTDNKRQGQ
jgi:hypothetical protein